MGQHVALQHDAQPAGRGLDREMRRLDVDPLVLVTAEVNVVEVMVSAALFNSVPKPGCAVRVITAPALVATTSLFFGLRLTFKHTSAAVCVSVVLNAVELPMISTPSRVNVSTEPDVVPDKVSTPVALTSGV